METAEYIRFTVEEVNAGKAAGWILAGPWRPMQLTHWAWFRKEVDDG